MGILGVLYCVPISFSVWILLIFIVTILYNVIMKPFTYWTRKGLKTTKVLPIIGDAIFGVSLTSKPYPKMIQEIYNKAGNVRYTGYSDLRTPLLMIKSRELIKKLFVKDSDSFQDRRIIFPINFDKFMSKTLIFLKGQEWKDVRSIWNMVLTTSKVEAIYPLIDETTKSFFSRLRDIEGEIITVDVKRDFTKYISEQSASIYFGIEKGSETFQEKLSQFLTLGGSSLWNFCTFCVACLAPKLLPFIGISSIVHADVHSYFLEVVSQGITRENNNRHRFDIIGLIHNQKKEEESQEFHENFKKRKVFLNVDEIASQLCLFLISSLDGLAFTLGFIAYELALNADVQKILQKELDEVRSGGEVPDFQTIMGLPYLDMVISETMRKWPAAVIIDRICTRPYTIEATSNEDSSIKLEIGDTIVAPLYALHHDPEYFPEPEKFDPERFSPENRAKIKPYSYAPWGIGPRNCNAGKLATIQMKIFFFRLLEHFEIVPVHETPIPIKLRGGVIQMASESDRYIHRFEETKAC